MNSIDKKLAVVENYDALAQHFTEKLVEKLRQHSAMEAYDFLDYWVPENDYAKGVLSMIDSAQSSGYEAIKIGLQKSSTAQGDTLKDILSMASASGEISIEERENRLILSVQLSSNNTGVISAASSAVASNESDTGSEDGNPEQCISAPELQKNDDIAKDIQSYLMQPNTSKSPLADTLTPPQGEWVPANSIKLAISHDGIKLEADISAKNHNVLRFTYAGPMNLAQEKLMERLSAVAVGQPIHEFCEHALLRTIRSIETGIVGRVSSHDRIREGVLLPSNAGAIFVRCQVALRKLFERYLDVTDAIEVINFHHPRPGEAWTDADDSERREILDTHLNRFLRLNGINDLDYLRLSAIKNNRYDQPTRCIFFFSETASTDTKPQMLRKLEAYIRNHIDSSLDVSIEKTRDKSPLRRL